MNHYRERKKFTQWLFKDSALSYNIRPLIYIIKLQYAKMRSSRGFITLLSAHTHECSQIKAITIDNFWQRWIGRQNKEVGGFGKVMTVCSHSFLPSVAFCIITTQKWRAAIVIKGLHLMFLLIQLQQHSVQHWDKERDEKWLTAV